MFIVSTFSCDCKSLYTTSFLFLLIQLVTQVHETVHETVYEGIGVGWGDKENGREVRTWGTTFTFPETRLYGMYDGYVVRYFPHLSSCELLNGLQAVDCI